MITAITWLPESLFEDEGIAWRVVDSQGHEEAIYDNATSAHDVRNHLNAINSERKT